MNNILKGIVFFLCVSGVGFSEPDKIQLNAAHSGTEITSGHKSGVATKMHCVSIDVERGKPISILTPKKPSAREASEAVRQKASVEPYKVVMTVKGKPNWEVFSDYQAAKDFAAYIKKNGSYQLCTFTPPPGSGPEWTEIMVTEDSGP